MRNLLSLWRREIASYFISPAAYVTSVFVVLVTGGGVWLRATLMSEAGEPPRVEEFFWLPTLWLMVLMVATVLTMHLFAEETRSGTIETLMTAPVTEVELVLSKYLAAVAVFAIVFAPTVLHVFVLRRFSSGMEVLDPVPILGGHLIVVLAGSFYISIGLFMSSISRSQIVAAIGSFAVLCVVFILVGGLSHVVLQGGTNPVFDSISTFQHIKDFSRGIVDTRPVIVYFTGTALTLFCTIKVLESRRWL